MIQIKRLSGAIGAQISGVDLRDPPDADMRRAIREAWLEHQVILFRDQDLSAAQFLRFAQTIGTPIEYPFVKGLAEFPEIIEVKKLEHERQNFGGVWHSDTAYLEVPPMASMLLARELPPQGGDTLFANQVMALEALSPGMQQLLSGLRAVNSSAKADVSRTREDRIKGDGREDARKEYVAEHPVVRTHPENGKRSLYVNTAHTLRFVGMTEEESAPLLQFLHQHQIKPEFTCRIQWTVGALALWDNRSALHNPINDYHGYRRVMQRITLAGTRPA